MKMSTKIIIFAIIASATAVPTYYHKNYYNHGTDYSSDDGFYDWPHPHHDYHPHHHNPHYNPRTWKDDKYDYNENPYPGGAVYPFGHPLHNHPPGHPWHDPHGGPWYEHTTKYPQWTTKKPYIRTTTERIPVFPNWGMKIPTMKPNYEPVTEPSTLRPEVIIPEVLPEVPAEIHPVFPPEVVPSESPAINPVDVPTEVPPVIPEVYSEAPVDISPLIPEVPSKTPEEISPLIPAVPSETSAEISPLIPADIPPVDSIPVPSEIPAEVPAEISPEIPAALPSEIPAVISDIPPDNTVDVLPEVREPIEIEDGGIKENPQLFLSGEKKEENPEIFLSGEKQKENPQIFLSGEKRDTPNLQTSASGSGLNFNVEKNPQLPLNKPVIVINHDFDESLLGNQKPDKPIISVSPPAFFINHDFDDSVLANKRPEKPEIPVNSPVFVIDHDFDNTITKHMSAQLPITILDKNPVFIIDHDALGTANENIPGISDLPVSVQKVIPPVASKPTETVISNEKVDTRPHFNTNPEINTPPSPAETGTEDKKKLSEEILNIIQNPVYQGIITPDMLTKENINIEELKKIQEELNDYIKKGLLNFYQNHLPDTPLQTETKFSNNKPDIDERIINENISTEDLLTVQKDIKSFIDKGLEQYYKNQIPEKTETRKRRDVLETINDDLYEPSKILQNNVDKTQVNEKQVQLITDDIGTYIKQGLVNYYKHFLNSGNRKKRQLIENINNNNFVSSIPLPESLNGASPEEVQKIKEELSQFISQGLQNYYLSQLEEKYGKPKSERKDRALLNRIKRDLINNINNEDFGSSVLLSGPNTGIENMDNYDPEVLKKIQDEIGEYVKQGLLKYYENQLMTEKDTDSFPVFTEPTTTKQTTRWPPSTRSPPPTRSPAPPASEDDCELVVDTSSFDFKVVQKCKSNEEPKIDFRHTKRYK